ncbi:hypothetical protein VP01_100g18 [Puccinia sorghi]|uniref:Tet-like 2OG-Fe(II) oxygenase domain-containing protein n=1 Tax=Puccinia sorghi TaxID=27349 RepID=A0A0L6VVG0_9BASI|nr:hypothetical protein VP01_100g18 [Puccinia sorghi]
MTERKTAQHQTEPLCSLTSSCPHFQPQTQCQNLFIKQILPLLDISLKSQYQNLIAQYTYQNPNKLKGPQYSVKMYRIQRNIGSSKQIFLNKTILFKNIDSFFSEDPNGFTCHLSFTISNFANLPHKENNASPFTLATWIPIKQTTGKLVEEKFKVKGGFNGIIESAWKATEYSHLNLPSHTPSQSLHTFMRISSQLPKKTQAALEKN